MSKAFYPTNDGHIGNLKKLSTIEIQDILKRQDDLLKKKQSILNKLPDKGARIKGRLDHLQQELKRRETENSVETSSQPGKSQQNKENETLQIHIQMNTNHTEEIKSVNSENLAQNNVLEDEFQKLSVEGSKKGVKEKGAGELGISEKQKHQYELALERAEKNLQSGLKQPMRLNRALKVEHVKDLPDEIVKMKGLTAVRDSNNKQHQSKMECSHLKVNEESSAVPPNYKFSEVKMIDLTESLQLQQQQKQVQEELNAELAAEKLAERLHIKMEVYNPEGVDMSYRSARGGQSVEDVEDSDDDEDDVDTVGYSKTLVPSDTED